MKTIQALSILLLFSGSALIAAACNDGAEPPEPPEARCNDEADCQEGLACISSQCTPCQNHQACASDVCDVYLASPLGAGRCISERNVLYVESRGYEPVACERHPGTGSREDPFCSIRAAVSASGGEKTAIRVYPGTYFPFGVRGNQQVSIYGPAREGGIAVVSEEDLSGIRVEEASNVALDGLTLGLNTVYGVRCIGEAERPNLTIRRSDVLSDIGRALDVSRCDLRLDRTRLVGARGGLALSEARYEVTNSIISDTYDGPAVRFENSSGRFLFNTVIRNGTPEQPGVIDCGTAPVVLQDSLVFNNTPGPSGSQLAGACSLERVVVGTTDTTTLEGAIRLDPELKGYQLPRTEANRRCCIDQAPTDPAAPTDFDGTPRPQGPRSDIGAYEAPHPD